MTTLAVKFTDGQVAEYPLQNGVSAVKVLVTPDEGEEASLGILDVDGNAELLPLGDIELFEVMT